MGQYGNIKSMNIGIEEVEIKQTKGTENIFNIIEENVFNLKKVHVKVKQAYKYQIHRTKKKFPTIYNNENIKHPAQRKNIKSCKQNMNR